MPESIINYARQSISSEDIEAVVEVLRSDFLTQGPVGPTFEKAVADYCGVSHAVATNSATSALHIACLALGLKSGDVLWTVPNTFVASANCARYCGAEVDFVDIDISTGNICLGALSEKLATAAHIGRLPKIVIPVAFAGLPCDMAEIKKLSQQYGFAIIEDASHAVGARYHEQPVGCGKWADITVFSFHPVKIITCGEGGMALTNNPELAHRMSLLRSHGITRDAMECTEAEGAWFYEMQELGWNYRMTDIHAALGLSQLKRLDEFVFRRTSLAWRYDQRLAESGLILPRVDYTDRASSWHLYVVGWNEKDSGLSRAEAFSRLRECGIMVNVHYIPVHWQPYYRRLGFTSGQFPQAEKHYHRAISLPLYPGLTEAQQDRVIKALFELRK